jgi:preprotein translocase subunit SecA
MDYLREGIGLRGYAQRDPLVEYQREGFDMFTAIMDGIKEESVGFLFNLEVQLVDEDEEAGQFEELTEEPMARELPSEPAERDHRPQIQARGLGQESRPANLSYSAPSEDASVFGGGGEAPAAQPGRTVTNADDEFAGVGRNALCPCGSGKKYKRCHGAPGGPTGLTARVNG